MEKKMDTTMTYSVGFRVEGHGDLVSRLRMGIFGVIV